MTGRNGAQAGFTLLEVLVALVVLGFILAGLGQGVRFGLRAGETQARQSDGRSELDAVDRALRRLIEAADPGTGRRRGSLRGTAGRLAMVTDLPQAAAVERHADVAIGVDGAKRLMLRWTPHRHAVALGPPPTPQETELLQGVDHIELAYWQDGWRAEWTDAALPGLVRLRVVFPPNDIRRWPDIVVAPKRDPERR